MSMVDLRSEDRVVIVGTLDTLYHTLLRTILDVYWPPDKRE